MISDINSSIVEKKQRLKVRVERAMDILIESSSSQQVSPASRRNKTNTNNVSFAAYGAAGILALLGCVSSSGKAWLFAGAIAAGVSGYMISQGAKSNVTPALQTSTSVVDKSELKNKVLQIIREVKDEWVQFMSSKQILVQSAIDNANISDTEKESDFKKIFVFQEIEIPLSKVNNLFEKADSSVEISNSISFIKSELLDAIDTACTKQLDIYNSLILN